jgi:hypothetical protein
MFEAELYIGGKGREIANGKSYVEVNHSIA